MPRLTTLLLMLLAVQALAASPASQHALTVRGDRFTFTRKNMVITDGSIARFEPDEAGGTMRLADNSPKAAGAFYLHFPILLRPWTKYVLSYSATVDACAGAAPYVEVAILDANFDPARQVHQEITKGDKRELAFTTRGDECALVLYIRSTAKGTCKASLRDVVLEQVGEAGTTAPPLTRTLDLAGDSGQAKLAKDAARAEMAVEMTGAIKAGNVEVLFAWTMADGSFAAERLVLTPIFGSRQQWNGTRAEWYRMSRGALDDVPHRCQLLSADGPRTAQTAVKRPVGANAATVTTKRSSDFAGDLHIERLVLATRPADAEE